jgi:hypothetical protein
MRSNTAHVESGSSSSESRGRRWEGAQTGDGGSRRSRASRIGKASRIGREQRCRRSWVCLARYSDAIAQTGVRTRAGGCCVVGRAARGAMVRVEADTQLSQVNGGLWRAAQRRRWSGTGMRRLAVSIADDYKRGSGNQRRLRWSHVGRIGSGYARLVGGDESRSRSHQHHAQKIAPTARDFDTCIAGGYLRTT